MLQQYMRERSYSNVIFVTTVVHKRAVWINILHQFMREISKKSFKFEVCDYSCTEKSQLNQHVAAVHQIKKQFKCKICKYSCSGKSILEQHQFMRVIKHSNVKFVATNLFEKATWKSMLHQFMRTTFQSFNNQKCLKRY